MFILNDAINIWATNLRKNHNLSNREVTELRDHLESEIEKLKGQGFTDQQALHNAKQKLGDAKDIYQELSKNAGIQRMNQEYFKSGLISMGATVVIWVLFSVQMSPFYLFNIDLIDILPADIANLARLVLLPTAFLIPAFIVGLFIFRCSEPHRNQVVVGTALATAILVMSRLISFIPVPSNWDLTLAILFKQMVGVGGALCLYTVIALSLNYGIRWSTRYLANYKFAS